VVRVIAERAEIRTGPSFTYRVVYRAVAEQVFCTNVAGSPLIARPDGRQTHGGGKLIDPDGPEAALVKRWVETR
jgi:hypothetical protein